MQVGDTVKFKRINASGFEISQSGDIVAEVYSLHRGYAWLKFTDPETGDVRVTRVRPDSIPTTQEVSFGSTED